MNNYEKLELLIAKGCLEHAKLPKCDKRKLPEFLSSYLIKNNVDVKSCPICTHIHNLSETGYNYEMRGFVFKYCPACGEEL